MIRKSTININNANTGKLNISDDILHEYSAVHNFDSDAPAGFPNPVRIWKSEPGKL